MHENAIQKIKGIINASLKQCELIENWPEYESFKQHVDSLSNEILKHKSEWLTRADVYSIYYDLVYEFVINRVEPQSIFTGKLCELVGEKNIEDLVNIICGFYISIPRNYSIYLPLPKISKILQCSIPLSDKVEIEIFDNAKDVPGHFQGGVLRLLNKLDINVVYLKVNLQGYCSNRLENKTIRQALSSFKIILQQGLFKDLFKLIEDQPAGLGLLGGLTHYQIPKSKIISVDKTDGRQRTVDTELPIEISKFLNAIDFDWNNKKLNKVFEAAKFDILIKDYLKLPSLLIESDEPESLRIKAAIEWCFDSQTTENETLSFLMICIGLESLLGEDESNGNLTETLADRCAYLISNNIKGRRTIKDKFKALYKIRSKLVHGVKTTLEPEQISYKFWGLIILKLLITAEIKHLDLK